MFKIFFSLLIVFSFWALPTKAADNIIFQDFENSSSFVDNFTQSNNSTGSFVWSATGGIGNSGKVNIPSSSDVIYTTKQKYSIENNGVYTLQALFHSQYNNGYGSFGFTTEPTSDASGSQGSPSEASIGISFHAGGGSWMVNNTLIPINWIAQELDTDTTNAEWYLFELKMTDQTSGQFYLEFTIFDVDQTTGTKISERVKKTNTVSNVTLKSRTDLYVFFGAQGQRMIGFDNFEIKLSSNVVVSGAQTGQAINTVFLTSSSPSDDATDVALNSNIVLTFSEHVQAGSGDITLYDSNDHVVEVFDVTTDITISGSDVTLIPTYNLSSLTEYYVKIDKTAIEGLVGNSYAGISDKTILSFTSIYTFAPTFTFNPANGATGVAVGSNITITASEAIRLVAGDAALTDSNVDALITLKETDASGTAIAFDATISGNVITINPTSDLGSLQQVYVSIDGTLLEDTADNQASAANATFTTAQIIEDLIDQIRDDLTEILNNDMRGAIDGQQAVISQTSKSALDRLRAGNDTTGFCGDQTAPDTTGGATASAQLVDINAAQSANTYDCVSGTWITQDTSLRVTKTDGAGVQYNLGYSVQTERFVSDIEVRGSFFGAYASRSNVSGKADGSIRGVGVNGGIFGAQELAQGYLFDYYLGGSLGAHTFDLQFPTSGLVIDADGRYTYGALITGAAIGREAEQDEMVLLPRVGFDAILAKSLNGSVDASQGSLTDRASIQLDDYRKLRVFGELELTGPLSDTIDIAGMEREWTYAITPRVICDRVWPASSFECGYAATLSVAGYDNSAGITSSIDLTGEDVGTKRSIRLSASRRQEIMDGAGAFVTTLGGTPAGDVSVGQSLNINF